MAIILALLVSLYSAALLAEAATLDTMAASYRTIPRERQLDGLVEAVNQATASAQTSGRVLEINFDVDDFVEQGSVLLRISDNEQKASVARAEAALNNAQSRLAQAQTHFNRISDLRKRNSISQAEFDTAEADLKAALAQLQEATAALDQAREQLQYTILKAPYSGIVTARLVQVGETVAPGTPLMSGFSLDRLRISVAVPERLLTSIRQHNRARVLLPGDEGRIVESSRVTYFPFAQPGTNTITVRADLPEKTEGIYPGMLVKVAFAMGERRQLVIPANAVVYRSEVVGAYVLTEDGRIGLRHIRVGNTLPDGAIEVLAGLDEGERVALDPVAAVTAIQDQLRQPSAAQNAGKAEHE